MYMENQDRLHNINILIKRNYDTICIFILMYAIFSYIMFECTSDLPAHVIIAKQKLVEDSLFSQNFLLYFFINLLSLFSGKSLLMKISLIALISFSNTAKYEIVKHSFVEISNNNTSKLISASLLVVFVVPVMYFMKHFGFFLNSHNMYLGYFVPNVWHNSTVICMMPFAIVVYFLSLQQFHKYNERRTWEISFFLIISILIKPSFFFIFIAAYTLINLYRYRISKTFFHSLIPILLGCVCVIYEYISIYKTGIESDSVVIDIIPLFTIAFWKDHLLYFVVSIIFPLIFLISCYKKLWYDIEFWFNLIMLVFAVGIFWCCRETGIRVNHGNFYWQIVPAMWFIYYYIAKCLFFNDKWTDISTYEIVILKILYIINVLSGILYLSIFLLTKSYA